MKNVLLIVLVLGLFSCVSKSKPETPEVADDSIVSIVDSIPAVDVNSINVEDSVVISQPEYIDEATIKKISPVISKWLKFYDIELKDFTYRGVAPFDLDSLNNKQSVYYRDFEDSDDVYIPQLHDYSPNRRYYINLMSAMIVDLEKDGRYHFRGSDDSQHLVLVDRNGKKAVTVSYRGFSQFIDAVFWAGNNIFIFVGYEDVLEKGVYVVEMYDIQNKNVHYYALVNENGNPSKSYMDSNMKSRGIVVED